MMPHNKTQPLILMVSYTHVYDDPRVIPMAQSLIAAGYRVQAVGLALREGLPTHGSLGNVPIFLIPLITGRKFSSLLRAFGRWMRGDTREVGVPANRQSSKIASLFFNLWIIRFGLGIKPSAVHCHTYTPLPAAWLLAKWHRIPLVYDSSESVPEFLAPLKDKWIIRLIIRIEQMVMTRADAVITVGERLQSALLRRGARRVSLIGSWKRLEDFAVDQDRLVAERKRLNLPESGLIIAYLGLLHPERSLEPLLEALIQSPDVTLLISGSGVLRDKIIAAAETAPNIRWLGWVDMADIPLYTHLADAVYYCLDPEVILQAYYSTPNKLFEAFAAGKVLIVRRRIGEIGEIVERTQTGILLDDGTVQSIKGAFNELQEPHLLRSMQQRAYEQRENYNWERGEQRLIELYDSLVRSAHPISHQSH